MDIIEKSGTMSYNPQTCSLIVDGFPVNNTNIVDLVVESLRNRKKTPTVPGWKTFVHECKKAGGS